MTREMKGKRRPNGVPQRAGFVRISRAASCRRAHPSRRKWARPMHVGLLAFTRSARRSPIRRGDAVLARASRAPRRRRRRRSRFRDPRRASPRASRRVRFARRVARARLGSFGALRRRGAVAARATARARVSVMACVIA